MKTAVEFLIEQLSNYDLEMIELFNKEIKQAKKIEKQQIIDAFDVACEDENRIGQEYYNQTFKK
jgi:hypothetical protein